MAQIVTGVNTANGYYENTGGIIPSGNFTLEILFKTPGAISAAEGVFETSNVSNSVGVYIGNGGAGYIKISTTTVSNTFTLNTVHHFMITVIGSTCYIYFNGAYLGSRSATISISRLRIGIMQSRAAFRGSIRLIRIFNRALSTGEVTARYNAGKPETWVEPDGSGCIAEFRAFSATTTAWEESRGNGLQLSAVGTVALETVGAITTGIPWGDKSKDSITATFTGTAAESPMLLGTERNDTIFIREKVITLKTPDGTVLGQITVDQVPT